LAGHWAHIAAKQIELMAVAAGWLNPTNPMMLQVVVGHIEANSADASQSGEHPA
jgi:hypothetical protein